MSAPDCPADESFACEALDKRSKLEATLATTMEAFVDDSLVYVRKCLKQQAYPESVDDDDKQTVIPKPIRDMADDWAALCMAVKQARLDSLSEHQRQLELDRQAEASTTGDRTLAAFEHDIVRIGAALFVVKPVFENWFCTWTTVTGRARNLHEMQILSVEDWLILASAAPGVAEREEAVQRCCRICKLVQSPIWSRIVRDLVARGEVITMQTVTAGLNEATLQITTSDTSGIDIHDDASPAFAVATHPAPAGGSVSPSADSETHAATVAMFDVAQLLSKSTKHSETADSSASDAASGDGSSASDAASGDGSSASDAASGDGSSASDAASGDGSSAADVASGVETDLAGIWGLSTTFVSRPPAVSTASDETGQRIKVTVGDHKSKLAPVRGEMEIGFTKRVTLPRKLLPSGNGCVMLTGTHAGADVDMACMLINSRISEALRDDDKLELFNQAPALRHVTVHKQVIDGKVYIAWCLDMPGGDSTHLETVFGALPDTGIDGESIVRITASISMSVDDIVKGTMPLASLLTGQLNVQGTVPAELHEYIKNMAVVTSAKDHAHHRAATLLRVLAIVLASTAPGTNLDVSLPPASAATTAVASVLSATGHDKAAFADIATRFALGPFSEFIINTIAHKAPSIVDGPIAACIMRTIATVESIHLFVGPLRVRGRATGLTIPYLQQAAERWMQPDVRAAAQKASEAKKALSRRRGKGKRPKGGFVALASSTADEGSELPVMTLEEVKKHATDDDCFIVVDGFVCNVTNFLEDHPGSAEQLMSVAGQDATEEFFDYGHSGPAIKKMKKLAVARLPDSEGLRNTTKAK